MSLKHYDVHGLGVFQNCPQETTVATDPLNNIQVIESHQEGMWQ